MTENIIFGQNAEPSLGHGEYSLKVTQRVKNTQPSSEKDKIDETYQADKKFIISSKRFSLNPDDIYATYPSDNIEGEFSNSLPHVILKSFTLPWERTPYRKKQGTPQTPWLGLLIIDETENPPPLKTITLSELQKDHLPLDTFFPAFEYEYGQKPTDNCNIIDIPIELFKKVTPSMRDLEYLAHTRNVSLKNKVIDYFLTPHDALENLANSNDEKEKLGNFSIIVGNRLPNPGKQTTVCLVSFEGFEEVLSDQKWDMNLPKEMNNIRLVCFKKWTFSTIAHPQNFETIIHSLNAEPLSYPSHASDTEGSNPLNMGYVAFNHHMREGDKTVSWYRGPLVPYKVRKFLMHRILNPDAALRYDPTYGMFDTAYAHAWQLGRLLALQNRHFRTALYNWRKQNLQKAASDAEARTVYEKLLSINPSLNRLNLRTVIKKQLRTPLKETLIEVLRQGLSVTSNK